MYGLSDPLKAKVVKISRASTMEDALVWSRLTHTQGHTVDLGIGSGIDLHQEVSHILVWTLGISPDLRQLMESSSSAMWCRSLMQVKRGQMLRLPQRVFMLSPHLSSLSIKNSNSDIVMFL